MEMNRQNLKELLTSIKTDENKVTEGLNPFDTALLMLDYLGDAEGEFRDDLVYSILANWIINGVFTKEQLRQLMNICLDEKHLFYKIGEQNTESVFMRAFSVLIIAVIVYKHRQESIFGTEELRNINRLVIQYAKAERDVRGYIEAGGWAHTAAHTSDALDELAQCCELGKEELLQILQAIKEKISISYHAYICYEDERLSIATSSLLERKLLSEEEVAEWIRGFVVEQEKPAFPNHYYLLSNIRNYLNSLYYRLPEGQYQVIKAAISETILKARRF